MTALRFAPRFTSWVLVTSLLVPTLAMTVGCGKGAQDNTPTTNTSNSVPTNSTPMTGTPPQHQGLSTKQKVVIVAGAALLYYLYKRHQAAQNAQAGQTIGKQGQLYRSKNGGVYYRDAQGKPIWVTAPAQGLAVPADQLQQYAPDYEQYQGQPAPPVPSGQQTVSADQYDPSLSGS